MPDIGQNSLSAKHRRLYMLTMTLRRFLSSLLLYNHFFWTVHIFHCVSLTKTTRGAAGRVNIDDCQQLHGGTSWLLTRFGYMRDLSTLQLSCE